MHVLSAKEIAEYIHEEHTPYSTMSFEEGKEHIAELIQKLVDSEVKKARYDKQGGL
jgi:hypothetical protein